MRSLSWILPLAVLFGVCSAHAAEIKCPPDVYSVEYDEYLKISRDRLGFSIEPQVYGSIDRINILASEFKKIPIGSGTVFVFSDFDLNKLHVADCENCSQSSYQALISQCNTTLGARCIDFAVVFDGKAQCMLIPKPEL